MSKDAQVMNKIDYIMFNVSKYGRSGITYVGHVC